MKKAIANLLHRPVIFNSLELANKHFQISLLGSIESLRQWPSSTRLFEKRTLQMNPLDALFAVQPRAHAGERSRSMAEIGMYRGGMRQHHLPPEG